MAKFRVEPGWPSWRRAGVQDSTRRMEGVPCARGCDREGARTHIALSSARPHVCWVARCCVSAGSPSPRADRGWFPTKRGRQTRARDRQCTCPLRTRGAGNSAVRLLSVTLLSFAVHAPVARGLAALPSSPLLSPGLLIRALSRAHAGTLGLWGAWRLCTDLRTHPGIGFGFGTGFADGPIPRLFAHPTHAPHRPQSCQSGATLLLAAVAARTPTPM